MSPNEKKALLTFLLFYRDNVSKDALGARQACGLCNNAFRYDMERYRDKEHRQVKPLLTILLERDFPDAMRTLYLPFNNEDKGMPSYGEESLAKLCHVNPWRSAWVFKIIQELSC